MEDIFLELYKKTIKDNMQDMDFVMTIITQYIESLVGLLVNKNVFTEEEITKIFEETNKEIIKKQKEIYKKDGMG